MNIYVYERRMEKNLSLRGLSERTGISKTTLNTIENGKVSPRLDQLERIATALNVSITDLFGTVNK